VFDLRPNHVLKDFLAVQLQSLVVFEEERCEITTQLSQVVCEELRRVSQVVDDLVDENFIVANSLLHSVSGTCQAVLLDLDLLNLKRAIFPELGYVV